MSHRKTTPLRNVAATAWTACIVLCFAIPMLGHVIGASGFQWAEGAFTAAVAGAAGALIVAVVTTAWAIQDGRDERQFKAAIAQLYARR